MLQAGIEIHMAADLIDRLTCVRGRVHVEPPRRALLHKFEAPWCGEAKNATPSLRVSRRHHNGDCLVQHGLHMLVLSVMCIASLPKHKQTI